MIPLWDFILAWNSRPGTTTGVNSPWGNSRQHDILWCYHVNNCGAMRGNWSELTLAWKLPQCHVNTGPWVRHVLMFPRLYLKWNSGIYKNFTLTNNNTIFFIQCFLLVWNYKLIALLIPSFYKIQNFISFPLSSGITFLFHAVCFPSPHDADVGENRLHDQLLKGMFVCEARSWDYCFMLVRIPFLSVFNTFLKLVHIPFLSVFNTFLKLFLYT